MRQKFSVVEHGCVHLRWQQCCNLGMVHYFGCGWKGMFSGSIWLWWWLLQWNKAPVVACWRKNYIQRVVVNTEKE